MTQLRRWLVMALCVSLMGCAGLAQRDPVNVSIVGIEPLAGEGLEARFAIKLRVQNPNDAPLGFDGVALDLELADAPFGSGVSDQRGSVPRFGDIVIVVPMTVPVTAILRQLYSFATRQPETVGYRLRGKLGGTGLGGIRFESRGEVALPAPPAAVRGTEI